MGEIIYSKTATNLVQRSHWQNSIDFSLLFTSWFLRHPFHAKQRQISRAEIRHSSNSEFICKLIHKLYRGCEHISGGSAKNVQINIDLNFKYILFDPSTTCKSHIKKSKYPKSARNSYLNDQVSDWIWKF